MDLGTEDYVVESSNSSVKWACYDAILQVRRRRLGERPCLRSDNQVEVEAEFQPEPS